MTIAIPGTRNDGLLYFFFIIYHIFVYMGSICYVPLPVEACNKDYYYYYYYMGRETVYCNLSSNMVEGEGCHVLAAR